MSRSRAPKCGTGRGCWVCGDQGQVRQARESQRASADLDPVVYGLEEWGERHWCCGEWEDDEEREPFAFGDPSPLRVPMIDLARGS